jgi:hypothetical protein
MRLAGWMRAPADGEGVLMSDDSNGRYACLRHLCHRTPPSDERRDENDRLLKSGQLRRARPGYDEPGRQDSPGTVP